MSSAQPIDFGSGPKGSTTGDTDSRSSEHRVMGDFPMPWTGVDDVLILGGAVPSGLVGQSAPLTSDYAPRELSRLQEFNLVIVDPLVTRLVSDRLSGSEPHATTDMIKFERHRSAFYRRRDELHALLSTGGVVVVFLRPISRLTAQLGPSQWERMEALELLAPRDWLRAFVRNEQTGRSGPPVDDDDPMTPYLRLRPDYLVTLDGGLLADESHGYPLAFTQDGLVTAYVEYVGRGVVYWVPPPIRGPDSAWRTLIDSARKAVGTRGQELDAIADDEQLRKLQGDAASALQSHADARRALRAEMAARTQLLESDEVLASAVRHFNTARTATPRRALDHFSRMHEVIKRELGGHKAARLLGYHEDLSDSFTAPANEPAKQIRHAASGPPEDVPAEVLAKAAEAAGEILRRFFAHRRYGPASPSDDAQSDADAETI